MTKNEERLEALEKRWEAIDRRVNFASDLITRIVLGFCLIYTALRFAGVLDDKCDMSETMLNDNSRWELVE